MPENNVLQTENGSLSVKEKDKNAPAGQLYTWTKKDLGLKINKKLNIDLIN